MDALPEIVQPKVRLVGVSPMIWRRVLIPSSTLLRELHGVIQVAMEWEGIHLFMFDIHAVRYGSFELHAANPDVSLQQFGFREKERFSYIYDMGDHWEHEVRIEVVTAADPKNPIRPVTAAPVHVRRRIVVGCTDISSAGTKQTAMTRGGIWASWLIFSLMWWRPTLPTDQYLIFCPTMWKPRWNGWLPASHLWWGSFHGVLRTIGSEPVIIGN